MGALFLVTDSLENTSSSLKTLESKVSDLASRIEGYDTICDDFDFGAAKSVLTNNMSACAIKIMNTAYVIQNVCKSHTKLQKSLKFGEEEPEEISESSSQSSYNGSTNYNSSDSSTTEQTESTNKTTTTTSSHGGSGGSKIYTANDFRNISPDEQFLRKQDVDIGPAGVIGAVGLTEAATMYPFDKTKFEDKKIKDVLSNKADLESDELLKTHTMEVIDNKDIDKIGMATVVEEKLTDVSKEFLHSNLIELDGGLMKTQNRYIIACDSSIGNVGDIIRFKGEDGTDIECVIGIVTNGGKINNTLNFLVADQNKLTEANKELCNSILNKGYIIEKYVMKHDSLML